ncbi:MerR family transcriptional regulator [Glacieibacterium frigidum]|uniref:MerR family transcriptional regulator n=1 Tax=Glacieibacterium frigidum TaxID=2593303 RepID=A0A552U718_9SPHN|nr:MerR family transcriptional regulator [Glacieibacterium frigidum]TRW14015.1 MerR family transcriptional regulator [Glacieibacterium frigidum]
MRELEQRTGVGRETIRFYIREGLLPEPARASRNSASYSDDHVTRVRAIKRLQEERFLPLAVIRSLLDRDDGDRWLEPQAFPQLDSQLSARLDQDAARVAVASVVDSHTLEHLPDLIETGMISVDADGTVSARDAAILRVLGDLNAVGFTHERGFHNGGLRLYLDFVEWVTTQEMRLFFEHTAGQVGESEAADMAERGVASINELLSLLRTRAILKKLGERRRIANDNS